MINAFSSLRTNFWEVPSPIVVTKASPLRRPTNNVRLFILLKQRGLKLPSKVTQLKSNPTENQNSDNASLLYENRIACKKSESLADEDDQWSPKGVCGSSKIRVNIFCHSNLQTSPDISKDERVLYLRKSDPGALRVDWVDWVDCRTTAPVEYDVGRATWSRQAE